ncbi:diacylglycerol kinase [Erythrobacter sp. LQ02-29]|uniref:diacylglycerol/lipid kinase family protein n=1 Tax=Erythrobacter sp. LQ02-29 TaxID=2920384 RepID=UPI001F4DC6E8|nr:diacylglycerol kinase family protein [Erythrobacter sp. LQ02-29]MCP9221863.1 diacylglycerol kinase [Erythrobacter sp. LQ02-29]
MAHSDGSLMMEEMHYTATGPAKVPRKLCLIINDASGSYSEDAVDALRSDLADAGLTVARCITCPDQDLPEPAELDADGIDCVAVFAGDGTISGTVKALSGWAGAVLPLPGGTMNLLCHRLHGEAEAGDIVRTLADGKAKLVCPPIIRSDEGQSLVSISAGPGVQWYHVRETMRDGSLGELLNESSDAVDHTLNGPQVLCREPRLGRSEGYPLIELVPLDREDGIRIVGYTADTIGGYIRQGFAIATRHFRDGPHEVLGHAERIVLANAQGEQLQLSFDGEPTCGAAEVEFAVDRCPVKLIAVKA